MKRYIKAAVTPISAESEETLLDLASDPTTSQNLLQEIWDNSQRGHTPYFIDDLSHALMCNPSTSTELLCKLYLRSASDYYEAENFIAIPNIPVALLILMADSEFFGIRIFVASNLDTPPEILTRLAKEDSPAIQSAISHNPNTPETVRETLQNQDDFISQVSCDFKAVETLARNPNTAPELLLKIASESHDYMACIFAVRNPNFPSESLMGFCDKYPSSVAQNSNAPADVLSYIFSHYPRDTYVRHCLAENKNTPVKILKRLAKSADYQTRENVGRNPNTPLSTLQQLADAGSYSATQNLNHR